MERGRERFERAGLWLLAGFTLVSLAGYAAFGVRPDRLALLPAWLAGVYGGAFRFFAQGHVWLSGLVLGAYLAGRVGFRWLAALGAVYVLSLSSELLGTGVGLPFGAYAYSELLGPAWFGRVPWVIPLSWFLMSLPSYALARLAHPERTVPRVALASLILLGWDLALDPAMSHATPYWVWAESGPYYGMPWLNLFGWYVTGLALMAALAAVRADAWMDRLSPRWLAAYYGLNLALPLGMCVVAGLGLAVGVTAVVLSAVALWLLWRSPALWRGAVAAEAAPGGGR